MSVVTYEEVLDLPNCPDKYLIDVRDPPEIKDTGSIPTSINIPRKYLWHLFTGPYYFIQVESSWEIRLSLWANMKSWLNCVDFEVGTLEETLKLPEDVFKSTFGRDKPSNEAEIIFSCKLGSRATKAAEVAETLGYTK